MRRLRPTTETQRVVAEWSASASPDHRQRLAELLRTLDDGCWETRWWNEQCSSEPEVYELRFDTAAHVFMRIFVDEVDGVEYADFISIEHSGASTRER
ncbi:hypothetical protein [Actinomadura rubrisoli]|uniref:Uncharacterized protein n=1 Tax=Actinomadura rubrisoli TaxID=2530368 RepID=A0A4R5CJW8_9ACTN|nr:hypothetical protein [Actinomadura rubrisoli]TDD97704.1 hypothetical protein E1298_01320 [Actinomadura rubrisoli]